MIYAWIAHRWIVNRLIIVAQIFSCGYHYGWIVYCEISVLYRFTVMCWLMRQLLQLLHKTKNLSIYDTIALDIN